MDDGRSIPKHCRGVRKDGEPCRGPVLDGGAYCFAHDPRRAAARRAARERGGHNRGALVRLHRLVPPRLLSIYDTLEQAMTEVHDGTLSPSRAMAMASLAKAMMAIVMAGEVEERLRRLEGRAG